MIWLIVFLLATLCAMICAVALLVWLGVTTLQGFLTCAERSLASFTDGHAITGLLYLVPGGLFLCAIVQGLFLAFSFITTVFLQQ